MLNWLCRVAIFSILPTTALAAYVPFPSPSTPTHIISQPSDNAASIKSTAGIVFTIVAINTSSQVLYLKFYDTPSVPSCGSSTVVQSYVLPANMSQPLVISPPVGINFLTGIGLCLVAGQNDNDDTPAAATGVTIDVLWN